MISHKHLSSYIRALHVPDSKRPCQLLSDNESIYSEDNVLIHQKVSTWLFEDGVVIRCEYEEEQGQHSDASCLPCWIEFKVQEIRNDAVAISPALKRFTNRCQIKTWLQFNSDT
ncbi:hypothetical protein DUQ00_05425 [Salmonella bongori]|uniref:Uncharacterized protein n=5 Tax=Salmonella TaxID=590 RepID=A0A750P2C0_SALER|nr:hypothetical protein [Salmonella bongori]EGE4653435.1 hypothetical protein [Salmonella bongori serovar 40:z35:- str. 95-0123]EGE4658012.1 hypothetical protein [Salmonella bongori serovar 48:i:- str. 94-0708]EGS1130044.1 hypothetical protein [Salmonella bongori CFSAN000509]HAC6693327.1 hypothetical protein [Salmonella bongori serovar 44:r:-]AGR60557.1 hypothetical protein A464_3373 [Salmonella bongori N268-08]